MAKKINNLLLLILAISFFITGCEQQKASVSAGQAILKPCPGFIETGKPPLVYGAECGHLMVKENPDDPESKEIPIEILRLPAISPAPRPDPLFLIQGGPGGSSIDLASHIHAVFSDVRKNRDLIFIDQRGTGKSNPLRCKQLSREELQLPEVAQLEKYIPLMKQCAEENKSSLRFYTTLHAIQDLDSVRRVLGYDTINLWGISYGTRVALEYAHRYPEQTRTMVLDAVAPKEIALSKFAARDSFAALAAVNNECQEQGECVAEFGDILQKAEIVYTRLAQADQSGVPLTINFEHPVTQLKETMTLSARNFSMLIFSALYSRDLTVLLPAAISRAEQEDYRLLAALFALSAENSQRMNIADAMHFSVICNEDWHFVSAEDVETTPPFFGLSSIKERDAVCQFWPKASLPDDYWSPIKSAVPALLLSGKHDPVTPAVWAEAVAQYLTNAVHLVAPGGNHGISTEGCTSQIIAQFIERGSMADVKTDCVANIKPLPLVLGANQRKSSSASSVSSSENSFISTNSSSINSSSNSIASNTPKSQGVSAGRSASSQGVMP